MAVRLSPAARIELLTALKASFGDRATVNATQLEHHSHSESWHPPAAPDVVVFPTSTDEVAAIVRAAAKHDAPVDRVRRGQLARRARQRA